MLMEGVVTSEIIRSDHTDRICSMCSKTGHGARRAEKVDLGYETATR